MDVNAFSLHLDEGYRCKCALSAKKIRRGENDDERTELSILSPAPIGRKAGPKVGEGREAGLWVAKCSSKMTIVLHWSLRKTQKRLCRFPFYKE